MATIMPESELLRRAVQYLDEARREKPQKSLTDLLDETAMRFNLGPADAADLERLFRKQRQG